MASATTTSTATRSRAGAAPLAVLLMAPFLAQADATIANVATPAIRTDLGASGAALELVIGGYFVAFAVLLITGARLGQIHGYKRLFLIGVAVFGGSSLGCGLAPDTTVLVGMRVLQGAGAALMFSPGADRDPADLFRRLPRARDRPVRAGAVWRCRERTDPRRGPHLRRHRECRVATDLPHQRADLPRGTGGRAALPAGRRAARRHSRRPARRGRAVGDRAPHRAAADPRPQRGLAGVDRGVPGRRPPRSASQCQPDGLATWCSSCCSASADSVSAPGSRRCSDT